MKITLEKINLLNDYVISQQSLICCCTVTGLAWLSKFCGIQYECYEVEWKDMVKQSFSIDLIAFEIRNRCSLTNSLTSVFSWSFIAM